MRQYHFVVYGTITAQGHIEFHIEAPDDYFPDGTVYTDAGDFVVIEEDSRDQANNDVLLKTLEKRIRS